MALVHGDLSPKNILVAKDDGHPVILDAECAWYGDPAFDAAFCLNHLILKAVHLPVHAGALKESAARFLAAWLAHFDNESAKALTARTAALLPCLMLARVDGKSPVEYLTPSEKQVVRDVSVPLIAQPDASLDAILETLPA
jgi:Ser/Thr protein kinase RdoA (MazF antagonist)